jgi:pimeloyl-ACP methyl ester carboxylesterase
MTTRAVEVPGASLHVELRGSGPFLLLLGGAAGAGGLGLLATGLAERFTVVTHDRRGLGGSRADDPDAPVEVATEADDVAAVLADLSPDPALVAGTSNGAVLGLELVVRHPGRVRALVAHEPPLPGLLPAAERDAFRAARAGVDSALAAGDPAAAAARLAALTGLGRPSGPAPAIDPDSPRSGPPGWRGSPRRCTGTTSTSTRWRPPACRSWSPRGPRAPT